MTPYRAVFRPDAIADITAIYDFVLESSRDPVVASRYRARIRAHCERIARTPLAGRPRDDIEQGLRSWSLRRRVIVFYKFDGEAVVFTNIFARGRDYGTALRT